MEKKEDEEFILKIATKAANALNIPLGNIDPAKLLNMYSCLWVLFGENEELMRHWVSTYNNHLKFCPGEHLTDPHIDDILRYLQGMVSH